MATPGDRRGLGQRVQTAVTEFHISAEAYMAKKPARALPPARVVAERKAKGQDKFGQPKPTY